MKPEISSVVLEDRVCPLREVVKLNIDENKNHFGRLVLHNQDYLILSTGHTIEEALADAASQLVMTYRAYMRTPECEMSEQAINFKNKLQNLIGS